MPILPIIAAAALAGASAAGLIGQRAKVRRKAGHPPPGRLVDVGSHRLHIHCQGETAPDRPVVVIDAGQGDFSLSWAGVASRVAEFARVCTYDRAGLGWSDAGPQPRTARVMVEELRALLARASVPGPYVLVGASTGGMNVRLFAHEYPHDIAGLVLVDSAHEDQFSAPLVRQTFKRMQKMLPLMNGAMLFLVRSGLAALRPGLVPDGGLKAKFSPRDAATLDAIVAGDAKHLAAAAAELRGLDETHAQMRAARITTLGNLPLVVIRHGVGQPAMGSPEMAAALEETFERLQREMAALSTNGRLVVAERSGHAVQLDRPDLIVDAIREVVTAARSHASSQPMSIEAQARVEAVR